MKSGKDERAEGEMNDLKGRIKRQAGEWMNDKGLEAEGAADQMRGKAQKAVGEIKEAMRGGASVSDRVERRREHALDRDRDKRDEDPDKKDKKKDAA
jgi:uncharacterized protein YjbJ (UPF0337 family)